MNAANGIINSVLRLEKPEVLPPAERDAFTCVMVTMLVQRVIDDLEWLFYLAAIRRRSEEARQAHAAYCREIEKVLAAFRAGDLP